MWHNQRRSGEREKELGRTFEGDELERNIKLVTMKTSISAMDEALSNPEEYELR